MRIYLNGLEVPVALLGTYTNTISSVASSSARVHLGAYWSSVGRMYGFFNGLIDEASIYSRALSPAEVAALYAAGSAGMCKPPVITNQPQGRTVAAGASATLTVGVLVSRGRCPINGG